jgi:hypothetical protein
MSLEADAEEVLERLLNTNFIAHYFDYVERRKQRKSEI